jgi:hypothetical protein
MVTPGGKEPKERFDHGEWVILEGEEPSPSLRDGGGTYGTGQRPVGLRLVTFFVALITACLAVLAFGSVTIPILAQRPWVGPSGEEILEGIITGRAMKVRMALKNTGRTPALDLHFAARLDVALPPPAAPPPVPECLEVTGSAPQTVLFPETTFSKTLVTQQPINDDTVAAVLRNDKAVYLVGCAAYGDGIWWWHWKPRYTQFCKIFVPESMGNLGLLGNFEDCPTGNSAY